MPEPWEPVRIDLDEIPLARQADARELIAVFVPEIDPPDTAA